MSPSKASPRGSAAASAGAAMTALIVLYSFVNVARATWTPSAFAGGMGLPTLVWPVGGGTPFVVKHLAIAGYLALTAALLLGAPAGGPPAPEVRA